VDWNFAGFSEADTGIHLDEGEKGIGLEIEVEVDVEAGRTSAAA
jgi:hypothetical protein